eukprot:TRINITY_DN5105_c0_g3_i1.p1 TRINITY_DN5105_c0_g3~~TRINITY_DN5105_c0_g3_i1.p1  ORF type:complete len:906 (+),score=148.04 TRINITY_DN5105_c0_g3_i1:67-2784(+)
MSDSPILTITDVTGDIIISYTPPESPSLLSPTGRGNKSKQNSFNLCSDLIDYFDNKFVQQAHAVLEDLREELPKDKIVKKVNDLCSQMNTLSDILTSLQQDLIQQLLKNVNFELGVFNDRMKKFHTQEDINKCTVEILQQLVFLLESIMQAEQKDFFEVNDLIDLPVIANLESHVFDDIWRKYLKPRNLTILPFSPQRTSSLCIARRSIRRSMITDTPMCYDAEIRARDNISKGVHISSHRDSDGYGSSTSSSRPASQDLEEFISVEQMDQRDHLKLFSVSTASLDSGFQNDQQPFSFFPQLDLQEWSRICSVSSNSLASGSTESDEDENSFLSSISTCPITLGRGFQGKKGTLRRDRRGSQLDMSVALEYVKFKVSTAKKNLVLNKQSDVNINKTHMLVIQIESNMEEIVPHSFSIVRTIEEFQTFYSEMRKRHGKIGSYPKEVRQYIRVKNIERKIEDILNHMGINSQTRNDDILMKFIRKENGLSLITDGQDKHLHVEKTFFTPSRNRTPGSIPLIEVTRKPQPKPGLGVGTLLRPPISPISEEVDKVSDCVVRDGRKVLITTTVNNHEFLDAATLDILIENLTTIDQSRDNSKVPDPNFIQQFILGHRHFLKNEEFLNILVKKYDEINKGNSQKEQSAAWQMLAKIRLLRVVIIWLETFYADFYLSSQMSDKLMDFIEKIAQKDEATSSIHRIRKIMFEQQEYFDSKQGFHEIHQCKNPAVLLGTTLLKSHEYKSFIIAQQLSLIQMEKFKKVGFYEICIKILEGNNSSKNGICTPNLDAFITRSNQESTWIMSEVLSSETNKIRIEVVERAISVAKHCYRLKNYNTMMAILAGLQNRLVNRTKVINSISDKSRNTFEKLKSVMDFSGNFKNYRKETRALLMDGNKPCVPFFGKYSIYYWS